MPGLVVVVPQARRVASLVRAADRRGLRVAVLDESAAGRPFPSTPQAAEIDDAVAAVTAAGPVDRDWSVLAVGPGAAATAALVADALGLRHHPLDAVQRCEQPIRRREALFAAGVPHPEYRVVVPEDDDVGHLARLVGLPCSVGALDAPETDRVIVADADEAVVAVERARSAPGGRGAEGLRPVLVERAVPGSELVLVGVARRGILDTAALFDRSVVAASPGIDDVELVSPCGLSRPARDEVERIAGSAVQAVGLTDGAVHLELRADERFVRVVDVRGWLPAWTSGSPVEEPDAGDGRPVDAGPVERSPVDGALEGRLVAAVHGVPRSDRTGRSTAAGSGDALGIRLLDGGEPFDRLAVRGGSRHDVQRLLVAARAELDR